MSRSLAVFERFGSAHLVLARHAAFPIGLTPDLLYWLWVTFPTDEHGARTQVPWIAVSDLLLSPLCREVRAELFEMDPAMRARLANELVADPRFGRPRATAIAAFLQDYVQRNLHSHEPDVRVLAEAQQWAARAHLRPDETATELAHELSRVPKQDKGAVVRWSALVAGLSHPLAQHERLLAYGKALLEDAHGIDGPGGAALADAASGSGSGPLVVSGVSVPVPQSMRRIEERRRREEKERIAKEEEARQRQEQIRKLQAEEAARIAKLEEEAARQREQRLSRAFHLYVIYEPHDTKLAEELLRNLNPLRRQGIILNSPRDTLAGYDTDSELVNMVDAADLVLVLLSADLIADWGRADLQRALARWQRENLRLIPVILHPCSWKDTPLSSLVPMPRDGTPISMQKQRDAVGVSIARDLQQLIRELRDPDPQRPLNQSDFSKKAAMSIRVLFLAASPGDLPPLQLEREMREIQKRIDKVGQSATSGQVPMEFAWELAIRPSDLAFVLQQHRPDIVHFSGHGSEESGLLFENEDGNAVGVSRDALASLFAAFRSHVRCVVLSACWSKPQSSGISEYIDCVVGTDGAITDDAAITFAAGFYQALGFGRSVAQAFQLGQLEVQLHGRQSNMFHLVTRLGIDADQVLPAKLRPET